MTDFDCTEDTCRTPVVCLNAGVCEALPPGNEHDRVKQLIADTRQRLREVKP